MEFIVPSAFQEILYPLAPPVLPLYPAFHAATTLVTVLLVVPPYKTTLLLYAVTSSFCEIVMLALVIKPVPA